MKIVIIGNGAAALSAIEAICKNNKECEITVVSKEKEPAYTPCFLAQYVCDEAGKEKLALRNGSFYGKNQVQTILAVTADEIMPDKQKVKLSNGDELFYDQLLLAAGSNPIVPQIPGIESNGVFYFRNLSDADKITAATKCAKNAVVMGAGFIGLEIAEAIYKMGLHITVVEKEGWILPRMLDQAVAAIVTQHIREKGTNLITGQAIKAIKSVNGKVNSVLLEDGDFLPCDMLVVSIGAKPNLEMIRTGSIKTGTGVNVDDKMRTNIPNIYAAGDIAEIEINGTKKINPIHVNAAKSGEIAGSNMVGVEKRLEEHVDDMNVVTLFGLPILAMGTQKGERVLQHDNAKRLVKIYVKKEGQINGIQLVGDVIRGGLYLTIMKRDTPIDEFNDILSPHFNYGSILLR